MRYIDKFITIDGDTKTIRINTPITDKALYRTCVQLWSEHTEFSKLPFPFSEYSDKWVIRDEETLSSIKLGYFNG